MAYCEKCGAYIPDGQSKCLACGFDGAEEERRAAQAARQQEDQRAQVEQRRRERQEINKKWVESEQRRRERQEASKKWAESEQQHRRNMEELERRRKEAEEKAKKEAEQKNKAGDWQKTEYGSFRFTDGNDRSRTSAGHNKLLAALSYVNILFLIPLLFVQDDEFARFHAKQGARLFVCYAIARILGAIFSIGWLVNILLVIMMILGIKNALNDKWEPLPYIGKFKLF